MNKKRIISIVLLCLFIILTIFIKLNKVSSIDTYIFNLVRSNSSHTLDKIFLVLTFLGSTKFIVFLVLLFFILFLILKKNNKAYTVAGVLIISTLVNNIIKLIIRRDRPEALLLLNLVKEKSFSFPSGHTMASVSLYFLLIYFINKSNVNKWIKIVLSILLSILPILVMISRIYLGAHFATDVIGGLLISLSLLLFEISLLEKKGLL